MGRKQTSKTGKAKRRSQSLSDDLLPEVREGKDEMNLANFPIAVLSKQVPGGKRALKFQDTIRGQDGRIVKRTWLIQGGSEVGLPTHIDEDVYVALMELTQKQGFDKQKIYFSRYDLVKRLGWCPCGKCYARLEQSLLRLANVSFHAQNAFWDNEVNSYVTVAFTLIQGYYIYNETGGRKTERDQPNSWFMWSDQLHRSFKSGYLKFLDTNLYFSLQTPIARRLYRYLDRKFGEDDQFMIDLFKLAHEYLGISRGFRYPSEIKRKLAPALDELVDKMYLERWEVRGRTIAFVRNPTARHVATSPDGVISPTLDLSPEDIRAVASPTGPSSEGDQDQVTRLMTMLIERGVAPREARKLVQANWGALERVERAIRYFDAVAARGMPGIKNPGGFIVSLVREGLGQEDNLPLEAQSPDPPVHDLVDQMAYNEYIERQVDQYIATLPEGAFAALVDAKKQEFLSSERAEIYRKWQPEVFDEYATVFCRKDIAASLRLPDFDTWRKTIKRRQKRAPQGEV
ncbi:MAG: hypothetical protein D6723_13240 [Acidobacteria bacterium]|nr:MAG: hypothetical protein D6723_13240 [Acidobacteriota bacterium]